jgi:hypothetical protein
MNKTVVEAGQAGKTNRTFFSQVGHSLAVCSAAVELYCLYFVILLRLRRGGLKKTVAQCTRLRSRARPLSESDEVETVLRTRDLTRKVLKWHLLPNSCVPDALLPCWFLARRGIKADFVITIRQYPFMAHAQARWRELPLTAPPPDATAPESYITLMRK